MKILQIPILTKILQILIQRKTKAAAVKNIKWLLLRKGLKWDTD